MDNPHVVNGIARLRGFWGNFLEWIRAVFFRQEMELALVGLQNAGKSSFVNVLTTGTYSEDMIPTVGFNMRKLTKGRVQIKMWDLGGQPRFRSMWERYCRGVDTIVYMVDAADHDNIDVAKSELHELLARPTLAGIPLLVLGNKNDLYEALKVQDVIERMELSRLEGREVCCYNISCRNQTNLDMTLDWLTKHAKKK